MPRSFEDEVGKAIANLGKRMRDVERKSKGGMRGTIKLGEVIAEEGYKELSIDNIPSDYNHLIIEITGRSTYNDVLDDLRMIINDDDENHYDFIRVNAYGSSSTTTEGVEYRYFNITRLPADTAIEDMWGSATVNINGAQTAYNKALHGSGTATYDAVADGIRSFDFSGLWRQNDPITKITIYCKGGEFEAGSIVSLYGEP